MNTYKITQGTKVLYCYGKDMSDAVRVCLNHGWIDGNHMITIVLAEHNNSYTGSWAY